MMNNTNNISERLKQARIAAGYPSASAFAKAAGVPKAVYCRHERGERALRDHDIMTYCVMLKCSADWLLFGKREDTH